MLSHIMSFDLSILHILLEHRDLTRALWAIGVTQLGSTIVISGLTLVTIILLAYKRHFAYIAGLMTTVGGGSLVEFTLKHIVQRPRPNLDFQAYVESGYSFPSGHATMAMAFYGFIIFLVWRTVPSATLRILITIFLVVLILAIGTTRIYLGVHYPSDVVAGFAIGGFFVWIGTFVTKKLQRIPIMDNSSLQTQSE